MYLHIEPFSDLATNTIQFYYITENLNQEIGTRKVKV